MLRFLLSALALPTAACASAESAPRQPLQDLYLPGQLHYPAEAHPRFAALLKPTLRQIVGGQ